MEYEIWCRCLRQYRKDLRKMTQQTVADGIGISRSHYHSIEHGRTVVSYEHLYNLSKFFQVRLDVLLTFPMVKGKGRIKSLSKRTRFERV